MFKYGSANIELLQKSYQFQLDSIQIQYRLISNLGILICIIITHMLSFYIMRGFKSGRLNCYFEGYLKKKTNISSNALYSFWQRCGRYQLLKQCHQSGCFYFSSEQKGFNQNESMPKQPSPNQQAQKKSSNEAKIDAQASKYQLLFSKISQMQRELAQAKAKLSLLQIQKQKQVNQAKEKLYLLQIQKQKQLTQIKLTLQTQKQKQLAQAKEKLTLQTQKQKQLAQAKEKLTLQTQKQKQKKPYTFIKILGGWFALFLTVLGVIWVQLSQDYFKRLRLVLQTKNKIQTGLKDKYVHGSQVENELKEILDKQQPKSIKMIVGCPGVGKSSSVKQLLQQKIEKGETVFYFSFQHHSTGTIETQIDQLSHLLIGIKDCYKGKEKFKDKKVKVVIDDIEKAVPGTVQKVMGLIYSFASNEQVDLICISSSSGFVERIYNDSPFYKFATLYVLSTYPGKDFIQRLLKKQMEKFSPKDQQLLNKIGLFLFESSYTPRMINKLVSKKIKEILSKKKTNEEIFQELKEFKQKDMCNLVTNINNSAFQLKDKNLKRNLIKSILQQKDFTPQNCGKITYLLSDVTVQRIIGKFDQNNLTIFCKPRTERQRAAFQRFLNKNSSK